MAEQTEINAIYLDYGEAFLAPKAKTLYDLIVQQGTELHAQLGAITPSNCTSILLLLETHKTLSAVQIAQKLGKSHQLISQRINKLEKLELVTRHSNDADKRSKVVSLTDLGASDLAVIKQACHIADKHFQKLYRALDINIGQVLDLMTETLKQMPLASSTK